MLVSCLRSLVCLWVYATLASLALAETPQSGEITKLDGTKLTGLIEVTDDYTIRVTSDSGLQKIPLALLSENDFRKYGFAQDRQQDGRFWSERQDALENAQKNANPKKPDQTDGGFEIRLREIAAFQPIIDLYEKNVADQKQADSAQKATSGHQAAAALSGNSPMGQLFTQPAMGNSPFTGGISAPAANPLPGIGTVPSPGVSVPTLP